MNFNDAGSSYYAPSFLSSSSSSDDELEQRIKGYDVEQQLITQQIINNNLIVAEFLRT